MGRDRSHPILMLRMCYKCNEVRTKREMMKTALIVINNTINELIRVAFARFLLSDRHWQTELSITESRDGSYVMICRPE